MSGDNSCFVFQEREPSSANFSQIEASPDILNPPQTSHVASSSPLLSFPCQSTFSSLLTHHLCSCGAQLLLRAGL